MLRRLLIAALLFAGCGPLESCGELYLRSVEEGKKDFGPPPEQNSGLDSTI